MAKRKESSRQIRFEMDIVSKFEKTNTSVEELRTGIWAPVSKVSSVMKKNFEALKRQKVVKTSWGEVVVKGNILTQAHRDLLDCILAVRTNTKELPSGDVAVYFNRTDALKKYGDEEGKNHKWLKEKLTEIQTTAIELKDKAGNFYQFNILKLTAYSENENSYGIVFTSEYRKYIEGQLTIGYLDELNKLMKIESALLKSIIRFFWTHKDAWKMDIDDLLKTVGYPQDSVRMIRNAKKEIEDNIEKLEEFGIYSDQEEILEGKKVKIKKILYRKPEETKLTFIAPLNTTPSLP